MRPLVLGVLPLLAAVPAQAQHQHMPGMTMPMPAPTPTATPKPKPKPAAAKPAAKPKPKAAPAPVMSKTGTGTTAQPTSAVTDPAPVPRDDALTADMPGMDHSAMNHSTADDGVGGTTAMPAMDHAAMRQMDMPATSREPAPTTVTPPPPDAGRDPARAADAIWGADAMRASREQLRRENGGQSFAKLMVDRLEYRAHDGRDGYAWEGQAWIGGDLDRFALKSEGEGSFGGETEQAEVQALWSHAIGPWFDLQAGIRHDFTSPDRTHAVLAVQGLAPYEFEVDASLFLSDKGDVTARAEAELDQRITQRLILQPRAELNLAAQDIPELGIGAGLDRAEVGVRLRYEFAREFAPYIGVAQEWRVGRSADFARSRGDQPSVTSFVAGLRIWF